MSELYLLVKEENKRVTLIPRDEFHKLTEKQIKDIYRSDIKGELFELLTDQGDKTGVLKPREYVHKEGDWHGSFHLHIYAVFNGEPHILYQKRSMSKDVEPGVLDVVVGGHYSPGEGIEGGLREAREEIGLEITEEDVRSGFLGRRMKTYTTGDIFDREFQEVYVFRCDQPLTDYKLQREELDGIIAVKLSSMLDYGWMGRQMTGKGYFFNGDGMSERTFNFSEDDFWPNQDDYYFNAARAAQLIHNGETLPKGIIGVPKYYDRRNNG